MAEYIAAPSPTTSLVFVEDQIDKRNKLYKAIAKNGRVAEFPKQEEATLKKWILGMVKKEEKQISEAALLRFLEQTGQDMSYIKTEMEKLLCYCMERDSITEKDVEEIGSRRVQNQIFEMMSAMGNKEKKKAMLLYEDLLTLKEPPLKILALMARQFNIMLQVKELVKKGYGQQIIAEKIGLPPFAVKKYMVQISKFTSEELREALEEMVQTEEECKTGLMNDRLGVELLLVKYSS